MHLGYNKNILVADFCTSLYRLLGFLMLRVLVRRS